MVESRSDVADERNSESRAVRLRSQVMALGALSIAFFGLLAVGLRWGSSAFRPYFGTLHPLGAAGIILVLGAVSLTHLSRTSPFRIWRPDRSKGGLAIAFGAATGLGVLIIVADAVLVLPADLNVAWPQAFAFYPAMAYAAEIAFHAVPLGVLVVLARLYRRSSVTPSTAPTVLLVSVVMIEPLFQVLPSTAGAQPPITAAVIFVQVLLFNIVSLGLFLRFDFVTAYAFRVAYYLHWHILWGYARLELLF